MKVLEPVLVTGLVLVALLLVAPTGAAQPIVHGVPVDLVRADDVNETIAVEIIRANGTIVSEVPLCAFCNVTIYLAPGNYTWYDSCGIAGAFDVVSTTVVVLVVCGGIGVPPATGGTSLSTGPLATPVLILSVVVGLGMAYWRPARND